MKKFLFTITIISFWITANAQINKLTFTNTQGTNAGPETYSEELKVESKLNGTIQVPGGGNRSGLITIAPWSFLGSDPTNSQLAFNKSRIYYRHSNSDGVSWSTWQKILLDSDEFDHLKFKNTQHINTPPSGYAEDFMLEQKLSNTIGLPGSNRTGLLTIAPWPSDGADVPDTQLGFTKGKMYQRYGLADGSGWSSWARILLDTDEFDHLKFINTQHTNTPPSGYSEDFKLEQKLSGAIGLPGSNRTGLLTIAPWPSDGADVPDTQLGFTKGKMYQRYGLADGSGWSSWSRILTESDADLSLELTDEIFVSKIGINTENIPTEYHLAIAGKAIMEGIKVNLVENWSDFVFANDYQLLPLEKVEKFINENKHLPEIPSEAEVLKNGINLGEMDAKLLQKIEELTLHMIEMNKRMKVLEKENEELKK